MATEKKILTPAEEGVLSLCLEDRDILKILDYRRSDWEDSLKRFSNAVSKLTSDKGEEISFSLREKVLVTAWGISELENKLRDRLSRMAFGNQKEKRTIYRIQQLEISWRKIQFTSEDIAVFLLVSQVAKELGDALNVN